MQLKNGCMAVKLMEFVGLCGEVPVSLVRKLPGYYDYNRRLVTKLVQEGYLIRRPSPTDRRKTELFCTEKALPVIRRGRQLQADFLERLFADTDQETRRAFANLMRRIEENLDGILEGK